MPTNGAIVDPFDLSAEKNVPAETAKTVALDSIERAEAAARRPVDGTKVTTANAWAPAVTPSWGPGRR